MDNMNNYTPTQETYTELQTAFDHLNEKLFDGSLPHCLITYQRIKTTYGYHSGNRWTNRSKERKDEIAMNPAYFATRTTIDTLSTLAHEMVHLWQEHNGKPGRGRYHNKEWASKMKSIGLKPYNVDNKNRETGDRVTHYIIKGGLFHNVATKFIEDGFELTWLDRKIDQAHTTEDQQEIDEEITTAQKLVEQEENEILEISTSTGGKRSKYSCPNGHYSVWGKPNINPMCGECKEYMEEEVKE